MKSIERLAIEQIADDRGLRYNVPGRMWEFLGKVKDVHVVTLKPEAIRGNHCHHHTQEAVIVEAEDAWEFAWQTVNKPDYEKYSVEPGVQLICIPAGTVHAFHNSGSKIVRLSCFMDREFDMQNLDQEWIKLL